MMMIQPKNLTRNDDDTTKDPYQAELYKRQQNVSYELHWKKRKSRLYPPVSLVSLLLHD